MAKNKLIRGDFDKTKEYLELKEYIFDFRDEYNKISIESSVKDRIQYLKTRIDNDLYGINHKYCNKFLNLIIMYMNNEISLETLNREKKEIDDYFSKNAILDNQDKNCVALYMIFSYIYDIYTLVVKNM